MKKLLINQNMCRIWCALGLAVMASVSLAQVVVPPEIEGLMKTKNCFACHAVNKKVIGPSFTEAKASASTRNVTAEAMASKILKGGSGAYGPAPMPANPQVSTQEALILAKWFTSKD